METALCGLGVPPVDGLLYPPADTACYPSHSTVSRQQRPGERWLDGYRRVLSTAAQGKPFKANRRADRGLGCHGEAGYGEGLSVSAAATTGCVSGSVYMHTASQRANMLTN